MTFLNSSHALNNVKKLIFATSKYCVYFQERTIIFIIIIIIIPKLNNWTINWA